ncbi:MAG: prepilin-type N-terminal cleavage/methylation domain-containing protein [Arenicella sp.]
MSVVTRQLGCRLAGFTLIEILLVLALLSLIATLLPSGLKALYQKSDYQLLVTKVVAAARQCTLTAQQQQRSVSLGSDQCPLPADINRQVINAESLPLFHADGTASRSAQIVLQSGESTQRRTTVVMIDKLTANVSLQANARPR